ncbi:MAG: hypothetical protein IPM61_01080 [Chlorobi bacterium]|nr:hypothetical protein [Chlorobiota bacterium]MBX7215654.1 hypothetical protein [Candidatus Kapabacteria bacterium]
MTSPFCDTAWRRNVFLYPTEYLTNGIGWNGVHEDLAPIITKPDGSKEYRISDHLASLRASLTPGVSTKYYDYDPWGEVLGGGTVARRGFNENEKDRENGLFSLGVRKYEEGRFLSIDPLFEKEAEISPYVYAGNAPLNYVDPDGMQRRGIASVKGMALTVGDGLPDLVSAFGGAAGSGGMIVRVPGIGSGLSARPSGGGGGLASSGNWIRVGQASSSVGSSSRGGAAAGAQSAAQSKAGGGNSGGGNSGSGGGNAGGKGSNSPSASTPVGKSGSPMKVQGNTPTAINGVKFTGHALDRMQGRGILSPSTVLDVINNPFKIHQGNSPGSTVHVGQQMKVVTNQNGDVITVIPLSK